MKEHPLFKKLNFKRLGAGMLEPPFKPDVSVAHLKAGPRQGRGWGLLGSGQLQLECKKTHLKWLSLQNIIPGLPEMKSPTWAPPVL